MEVRITEKPFPFQKVFCINLDRRTDRWERFKQNAEKCWSFNVPIHRFSATDGWQPETPAWWRAGNGAWGCFDSHRRILRKCVEEGVESVLIFEDDALLRSDFSVRLDRFMSAVPDDWECVYLGGQHQHTHKQRPRQINAHVTVPYNVNRTHAYAFRGEGIPKILQFLEDFADWSNYPNDHIDHRLGRLHESQTFKTYCPVSWIVGQAANKSDIDGRTHAERWWDTNHKVKKPLPRIIPKADGVVRIGAWYPNLSIGGAEVWLRSLLRGLDDRFHVAGVALDEAPHERFEIPFGDIPIDVDHASLLQNVDVMIFWAVKGNLRRFEHLFRGPKVCISHGGCQWSRDMIARLSKVATHHTAVSEYCRRTFPPHLQDVVKVIPNGVDLSRVVASAPRDDLRHLLGIPDDKIALGYVGRLSEEKDPFAVARAVKEMPNAVAVYCGPDTRQYERDLRRMLGDRLIWTGYRDQVADVYGALDCLFLTSPSEGFSLTVAEAWAGGVPVVASDVGAMQMYPGVAVIVPTGADGQTLREAALKAIDPNRQNTIDRIQLFTREFLSSEAMCAEWGDYLFDAVQNYVPKPLGGKPPKKVFSAGTVRPRKIPRP